MKTAKSAALRLPLSLALAACIYAGGALAGDINTTSDGVAIEGYDSVGYFSAGASRQGKAIFETQWNGATWRFASAEERDAFAADPEAFAPQFGGYCANGLSQGHKVTGNPGIWRIIDGKLYLFHAERGRQRWDDAADIQQYIADAMKTWNRLKDE